MEWDHIFIKWDEIKPDFHEIEWDGISHETNSYEMKLENFLQNEMGLNLHEMRYPDPMLSMEWNWDKIKSLWNGTSRFNFTASLL